MTQEELQAIRESVEYVIQVAKENATEMGYGAPPSKDLDPRNFLPDFEVCTQKEINAWNDAVELAKRGESVEAPTHQWVDAGNGMMVHISSTAWGIGTYTYVDDETVKHVENLQNNLPKALDEIEHLADDLHAETEKSFWQAKKIERFRAALEDINELDSLDAIWHRVTLVLEATE